MDGITTLAPNLQFRPSAVFPSTDSGEDSPPTIDLHRDSPVKSNGLAILPFALWLTHPVMRVISDEEPAHP